MFEFYSHLFCFLLRLVEYFALENVSQKCVSFGEKNKKRNSCYNRMDKVFKLFLYILFVIYKDKIYYFTKIIVLYVFCLRIFFYISMNFWISFLFSQHLGVFQGSIVSPLLFSLHTSDTPELLCTSIATAAILSELYIYKYALIFCRGKHHPLLWP